MNGPRRLRLMLVYLAVCMAVIGGITFLLNPFGVWPVSIVPHAYVKAARGRIFPSYSAMIHERVDVALVGTSRTGSGFRIDALCKDGILNTAFQDASIVEMSAMVRALAGRGDVRRIFWEASFIKFDEQSLDYPEDRAIRRIQGDIGLKVSETVFSTVALKAAYRQTLRWMRGLKPRHLRTVPWSPVEIRGEIDAARARFRADAFDADYTLAGFVRMFSRYTLSPRRMRLLTEAVREARARGLEVQLFIPPVTEYQLEAVRVGGAWDTFLDWKRQLVQITPVWDFCAFNDAARDLFLFRDSNHFLTGVGWAMYRRMNGLDCDGMGPAGEHIRKAGVLLTPENIEEQLARQTRAMQERQRQKSAFRDHVLRLREKDREGG